jgi:hypothetical protein
MLSVPLWEDGRWRPEALGNRANVLCVVLRTPLLATECCVSATPVVEPASATDAAATRGKRLNVD